MSCWKMRISRYLNLTKTTAYLEADYLQHAYEETLKPQVPHFMPEYPLQLPES